jgi:hypothetical protein
VIWKGVGAHAPLGGSLDDILRYFRSDDYARSPMVPISFSLSAVADGSPAGLQVGICIGSDMRISLSKVVVHECSPCRSVKISGKISAAAGQQSPPTYFRFPGDQADALNIGVGGLWPPPGVQLEPVELRMKPVAGQVIRLTADLVDDWPRGSASLSGYTDVRFEDGWEGAHVIDLTAQGGWWIFAWNEEISVEFSIESA